MNPKTFSILAICFLAIAGTIVWNQMLGWNPLGQNKKQTIATSKASDRQKPIPTVPTETDQAMESGQEWTATQEVMNQAAEPWIKAASSGFKETSTRLIADLDLSAAQAGELEVIFARRAEQLGRLLTDTTATEESEMIGKICSMLRNQGLRDDLVGILSPQQLAAFDAAEANREREIVEARAYRDMAEVNAVLRLADHEKQEVFNALLKLAPEKVEEEANARAFLSLTYGPLADSMNPTEIRSMADMMNMDSTNTTTFDYGSVEHLQRMEQKKAERIDHEISTLQGILNESQLARYREHLQAAPP